MLKGIHLTLMMGKGIAQPVPKEVIDALTAVQVSGGKNQSGFQLSFTVGKNSAILNRLMPTGFFAPIITRVIITVTLQGSPTVLIDGLITNHELSPSDQAGASVLTITGEDLSLAMDLVQNIIPYPAMPDVAKVLLLLAPYANLGITPLVMPTINTFAKSPIDGFDTQAKETDRSYIQSLAQRNGYVFNVQPGFIPGQSIAYFGPDINIPAVQSALSTNLDAASNVESISFSLDGMAKKIKLFTIMDPFTRKIPIPVPVPNINPLKPPLGLLPTALAKVEFAEDASKSTMVEAIRDIIAFVLNDSNAGVTASGSLDVLRYGKILKSRMLVGVRGASTSYDGLYYVDNVTHNITLGGYKQNFTLSRDGLGAIASSVAV